MRLTLELEREGSMPPLPGDGMELIAFLSFAISRGFGATHPLIALADRLHDAFHVRFGPLTTFYEAGPDDNEDRAKLELAWQQPGPLRESMEKMLTAIQTDDQCRSLLRRANAEALPAQAEAMLPLLRRAEESGERVRMVYTL